MVSSYILRTTDGSSIIIKRKPNILNQINVDLNRIMYQVVYIKKKNFLQIIIHFLKYKADSTLQKRI